MYGRRDCGVVSDLDFSYDGLSANLYPPPQPPIKKRLHLLSKIFGYLVSLSAPSSIILYCVSVAVLPKLNKSKVATLLAKPQQAATNKSITPDVKLCGLQKREALPPDFRESA